MNAARNMQLGRGELNVHDSKAQLEHVPSYHDSGQCH